MNEVVIFLITKHISVFIEFYYTEQYDSQPHLPLSIWWFLINASHRQSGTQCSLLMNANILVRVLSQLQLSLFWLYLIHPLSMCSLKVCYPLEHIFIFFCFKWNMVRNKCLSCGYFCHKYVLTRYGYHILWTRSASLKSIPAMCNQQWSHYLCRTFTKQPHCAAGARRMSKSP